MLGPFGWYLGQFRVITGLLIYWVSGNWKYRIVSEINMSQKLYILQRKLYVHTIQKLTYFASYACKVRTLKLEDEKSVALKVQYRLFIPWAHGIMHLWSLADKLLTNCFDLLYENYTNLIMSTLYHFILQEFHLSSLFGSPEEREQQGK